VRRAAEVVKHLPWRQRNAPFIRRRTIRAYDVLVADPVSLIALGAALGGAAGKFAERAWDSSEKWLRERFGTHAAEAQEQARLNAAMFVEHLATRVKLLELEQDLNAQLLDQAQSHPQFSSFLQRTVVDAAQTSATEKHDLLARLVAARLAVSAETTVALASEMAADAISRSTRRQCKLLALCFFVYEIVPEKELTFMRRTKWIQNILKHFDDFQFIEIDARHLVALGCATYEPSIPVERIDAYDVLASKVGGKLSQIDLSSEPAFLAFKHNWKSGIWAISLTSVGAIIGGLAFDQIVGVQLGLPSWD